MSQIDTDKMDLANIATKLEQYSPLSDEVTLHNIITGINADEDVNVQDIFIVGRKTQGRKWKDNLSSHVHTNKQAQTEL